MTITEEQFGGICQAIAVFLPDWTLDKAGETYDMRYTLTHTTGLQMALFTSKYDKQPRLTVSDWKWPQYTTMERGQTRTNTVFPHSLHGPKESSPRITCSLAKSPEAIARDIKRRFLPEYTRIYQRCLEHAKAYQQHEDISRAQWDIVCAAVNLNPHHNRHYVSTGEDSRSVTLENRNGSLHLEFYASAEQAIRAIAMLTNNAVSE